VAKKTAKPSRRDLDLKRIEERVLLQLALSRASAQLRDLDASRGRVAAGQDADATYRELQSRHENAGGAGPVGAPVHWPIFGAEPASETSVRGYSRVEQSVVVAAGRSPTVVMLWASRQAWTRRPKSSSTIPGSVSLSRHLHRRSRQSLPTARDSNFDRHCLPSKGSYTFTTNRYHSRKLRFRVP
jgi:hypothetical protein